MTRAARYAYVILAWAFLVGLIAQVFFIGLGLFAGSQNIDLHVNFGWILHLSPLIVLLAAFLSRAGARHWIWAMALAAVVFVIPLLPGLRGSAPVVAALHPVGALAAFWLAIVVARNSLAAFRDMESIQEPAPETPAA